MFGGFYRFASQAKWGQRQWRANSVLFAAGASVAVGAGAGAKQGNTTSIHHHNRNRSESQALFHGLSLTYLSSKTFCEAAVKGLDNLRPEEKPINEEEEQFLDTLALYRRWFDDIKKQWDISKPSHTEWPTNIPHASEISALELDLQLYLKGDQAQSRRCQDLQFRIASYYLFREKSMEKQKKGFNMVKDLAVVGHPDGLCLYGKLGRLDWCVLGKWNVEKNLILSTFAFSQPWYGAMEILLELRPNHIWLSR